MRLFFFILFTSINADASNYHTKIKNAILECLDIQTDYIDIIFDNSTEGILKYRDQDIKEIRNLSTDDNKFCFEAKIESENRFFCGKYQLYNLTFIAKRFLKKDTEISRSDFEVKKIKINHQEDFRNDKISDIIGMQTKVNIYPNKAITKDNIKKLSSIKSGDVVTVIYRSGSLILKISAIAIEDGSPGDVIKLKNENSGLPIRGIVTEDKSVLVDEKI